MDTQLHFAINISKVIWYISMKMTENDPHKATSAAAGCWEVDAGMGACPALHVENHSKNISARRTLPADNIYTNVLLVIKLSENIVHKNLVTSQLIWAGLSSKQLWLSWTNYRIRSGWSLGFTYFRPLAVSIENLGIHVKVFSHCFLL